MKTLLYISTLLFVLSCATHKVDLGDKNHNLTQSYAEYRSTQVSDVEYTLDFDISEKKESYTGRSSISFIPLHNKEDLRVDFFQGTVKDITINGKPVPVNYNGTYIRLPKEFIVGERVKVDVNFEHAFSKSGRGFHRAVDPKDKRIYTYTNLEPFDANQVFPSFDQPDLKATYTMKVKAPKNWTVITSVRESKITKEKNANVWEFPKSLRFSTYIWSLHAGDYHVWKETKFRYPLRLFARKSLAKYVKYKEWFRYTRVSFDYFDEYFGFPYPYKKYDQVIVPEFFSGAMENVAAVTFSERMVSKGKKSRRDKRSLAGIIAHEMAHMWFGNLVTMKWWNDLWLNESFATYMAYKANYNTTEFKEAWRSFSGRKTWAIWEDELPTTHPIEGIVPDTFQARTNFDGISYGKGASVLRQVNFLIGEESFKKGMQGYFKKHAHQNTVLTDFMGALQSSTQIDLTQWQKEWLQTSGVNTVEADWSCEGGQVAKLELKQSYKEGFEHLRNHRIRVALVSKAKGKNTVETMDITLSGATTQVKEAVGKKCPLAIEPNYESYAYIKTEIDPKSLKNMKTVLASQNESFLRQEYWGSLWKMVREGTYSIVDFASLMQSLLDKESDDQIVEFLTGQAGSIAYYLPKETKEEKARYKKFVSEIEKQMWNKLVKAKAGSEQQKSLFGTFVGFGLTPFAQGKMYALLTGQVKLKKFKVDQDRRWSLIGGLSTNGFKTYEKLISRELKKDSSLKGVKSATSARAAFPSLEVKRKWYNKLVSSTNESNFDEFRRITWSLFPARQFELHKSFSGEYYKHLLKLENELNPHFASSFAGLAPVECDVRLKNKAQEFLDAHEELRPATQKSIKVKIAEYERCRLIRSKARK